MTLNWTKNCEWTKLIISCKQNYDFSAIWQTLLQETNEFNGFSNNALWGILCYVCQWRISDSKDIGCFNCLFMVHLMMLSSNSQYRECSIKLSDMVIYIETKWQAYMNVSETDAFQNYGPSEFLNVWGQQYDQYTSGYSACISVGSIWYNVCPPPQRVLVWCLMD